jgi:hypothetical protein
VSQADAAFYYYICKGKTPFPDHFLIMSVALAPHSSKPSAYLMKLHFGKIFFWVQLGSIRLKIMIKNPTIVGQNNGIYFNLIKEHSKPVSFKNFPSSMVWSRWVARFVFV